jgi:hypothetical protein
MLCGCCLWLRKKNAQRKWKRDLAIGKKCTEEGGCTGEGERKKRKGSEERVFKHHRQQGKKRKEKQKGESGNVGERERVSGF